MTNILVINSSVQGEASVSKLLVADVVRELVDTHPSAEVTYRNLGDTPIPHLTTATIAGIRGTPQSPAEHTARALSDSLLAELRAADIVVIGSAMYNFSVSTGLRSWFDYILRPGESFSYSEAGPRGLITGKRVIVVEARGGAYVDGPAQPMDFQEPYLKTMLGLAGMMDVTFIQAEKIGYGPEAREAAIVSARSKIAAIASKNTALAV